MLLTEYNEIQREELLLKKGTEKGMEKGMEKGKLEGQKQTAINLLNMNMDISFIEKATGLSKAEILKLQKSK